MIVPKRAGIVSTLGLYPSNPRDTILSGSATIMSTAPRFENRLRERRITRGWSQEELANRSGLSRAGVSAIENGRLVPSTAAALMLSAALDCRVEDLFRLQGPETDSPRWAWPPRGSACRYWIAEVGGETQLYPVEWTPLGTIPHDGVVRDGIPRAEEASSPDRTLVMACCDPAAGLSAAELSRTAGIRLLALQRSSRAALNLLGRGLVHAAGIHLGRSDDPLGNAKVVRDQLGPGYTLLRVALWEEGVALAPGLKLSTISAALGSKLRWVGREQGSGARECLDEILAGRPQPRRAASGHRGVAEAIRDGWADAGVCLRLAGEEAGLDFIGVRREAYEIVFPTRWEDDPRLKALTLAARSPTYRRLLNALPGYDATEAGSIHRV